MTLIVPKVWIHFSSSTRTPKSAKLSSRAPQTWPLLLCRASCSARAFSASIPDDRQDVCSGSHVHARNNRLQTRLFFSLETQNRDALLPGSSSASP